jgi:hypothetical protein
VAGAEYAAGHALPHAPETDKAYSHRIPTNHYSGSGLRTSGSGPYSGVQSSRELVACSNG